MAGDQPLLTPISVSLSLAPPRSPPHGSLLRHLLTGGGKGGISLEQYDANLHELLELTHHHDTSAESTSNVNKAAYQSHTLLSRILQLPIAHLRDVRHPHLPTSLSIPDQLTRYLGALLPLEWQHEFRDSGELIESTNSAVYRYA